MSASNKLLPDFAKNLDLSPDPGRTTLKLCRGDILLWKSGKVKDNEVNAVMRGLAGEGNIFFDTLMYTRFVDEDVPESAQLSVVERHRGISRGVKECAMGQNTIGEVKIFCPIFHKAVKGLEHWTMVMLDVSGKALYSMDSLQDGAGFSESRNAKSRKHMLDWIVQEFEYRGSSTERASWTSAPMPVPQQDNCIDCGVFICLFALYLSRGKEMDFTPAAIPAFRKMFVRSLSALK